jgi:putative transposase
MPDYRRYYLDGLPVFVTIVTRGRNRWLQDRGSDEVLAAMRRVKAKYPFRHLAHVILPDHLHWMFVPRDADFSRVVSALKRDITWRLKEGGIGSRPYWQDRFYDHVIRDHEDLAKHLDYIHYNPVRHGVAHRPLDYTSSSFGQWMKRGVYAADWGATVPKRIEGLDLE